MIRQVSLHLLPAMLAAIMVFTVLPFIETSLRIASASTPAIEWHGIVGATPEVSPGGILQITYKATVNKQCPSDIRGFLIAPDGTVPVRFPTLFGGYTRPADGPVDIRVAIPIPKQTDRGQAPFIAGEYIYRTLVTRYCADGVEDDHSVPDVKFNLRLP